jgi:hypothetical protein
MSKHQQHGAGIEFIKNPHLAQIISVSWQLSMTKGIQQHRPVKKKRQTHQLIVVHPLLSWVSILTDPQEGHEICDDSV